MHYAADTLFACVGEDGRYLRVKSHCNTDSPGPSLLWDRAGDWFVVVEPVERPNVRAKRGPTV